MFVFCVSCFVFIFPARDYPLHVPQVTSVVFLCNKSFIDQACSDKMAGYWPRSFFPVFMEGDGVEVSDRTRKTKNRTRPIRSFNRLRPYHNVCGIKAKYNRTCLYKNKHFR